MEVTTDFAKFCASRVNAVVFWPKNWFTSLVAVVFDDTSYSSENDTAGLVQMTLFVCVSLNQLAVTVTRYASPAERLNAEGVIDRDGPVRIASPEASGTRKPPRFCSSWRTCRDDLIEVERRGVVGERDPNP